MAKAEQAAFCNIVMIVSGKAGAVLPMQSKTTDEYESEIRGQIPSDRYCLMSKSD